MSNLTLPSDRRARPRETPDRRGPLRRLLDRLGLRRTHDQPPTPPVAGLKP